jgi:D-tyrosyl-tRNA(Tyr) deacylase
MRTVLQRVKSASVAVDGELISTIGKGILVFAAVSKDDTEKDVESMAGKVLKLKMWDDEDGGRWKRNVLDIKGEVLCVSQFTLLASTKKGNKPDFHQSASGVKAKELYRSFFKKVQDLYEPEKVKDGIFAAMMDVTLVNDGPVGVDFNCMDGVVTIQIDTNPPKMEIPSGLGTEGQTVELNDLVSNLTRITKEFQISAELLE